MAAKEVAKEVGKKATVDIVLDFANPSKLADQLAKLTTGEDSKTAHKKAIKFLQKTKFQDLELLDFGKERPKSPTTRKPLRMRLST